jgi:chromate transporter
MDDSIADSPLWLMTTHLALLSFAAVGGGVIMLAPDIHRYVVGIHHWVSDEQFAAAYAIAQAAPGPNMLFVTMVGWQVAGWLGAIMATCAVVIPPALLTFVTTRVSSRRSGEVGRFGKAVRNGLAPLSVGLLLASVWVLFDSANDGWREAIAVVLTLIVLLRTKINPLWLILIGAVAGIVGLIG